MAEELIVAQGTKKEKYETIVPQIRAIIEGETDLVANLANICAALKEQFDYLWVGFYLVKGGELVVSACQGPVACTRIRMGKGVCGTAWAERKTIIIPDVEKFPGHIACSSLSRSEIVLPIIRAKEVVGVLDADSDLPGFFDHTDKKWREQIVGLLQI